MKTTPKSQLFAISRNDIMPLLERQLVSVWPAKTSTGKDSAVLVDKHMRKTFFPNGVMIIEITPDMINGDKTIKYANGSFDIQLKRRFEDRQRHRAKQSFAIVGGDHKGAVAHLRRTQRQSVGKAATSNPNEFTARFAVRNGPSGIMPRERRGDRPNP